MSSLAELLEEARRSGDVGPLVQAVPFARFLGIRVAREEGGAGLIGKMSFAPHLVGNAFVPALHGGTVGALLESTALFSLLWETGATRAPRIVSITVEFLRTPRTVDTFARAEITRQGRRVATVRTTAWQEDPAKPIAAANTHFLLPQSPDGPRQEEGNS